MNADERRPSDTAAGDRGLPLPQVAPTRHRRAMRFAMASIDGHGRVASRFLRDVLGWMPGQLVDLSLTTDHMVIAAAVPVASRSREASAVISDLGRLVIPAAIRRRAGISPGDRLLLAADNDPNTLHIYPPVVLTLMLRQHGPDEAPL
jgi:AbrB family looped-hinge helix DNA binding protein